MGDLYSTVMRICPVTEDSVSDYRNSLDTKRKQNALRE